MNPDGDTVGVVDRLSASLALDVTNFSVVNTVTGASLPFTLDTSNFSSDREVTVNVPDGTPVKIAYRAQISGLKGESVQVENSAWWKVIETAALSGYVLDRTPYYFVLGKMAGENVEYPDDFDDTNVLKGPAGIVVTAYDEPYVSVSFEEMNSDGVMIADATLQVLCEDGSVAQAKTAADADATQDAEFASSADGTTALCLAPGTYKLHEKTPPSGKNSDAQ